MARFVGIEKGWNRPDLTTQQRIDQQLTTSTHCAADPRGVSLPNIARRDWKPSKKAQPVPFFPIKSEFS